MILEAEDRVRLNSELISKTAFIYVSMLGSAILGAVSIFLATRFIGQSEYGIVGFALSFAGLFLFITDLGFTRAHTKKVSEGDDLKSCLTLYLLIRIALTGVYVFAVFVSIYVWEDILGRGYEYPETHEVILVILAYYVPISISTVFAATFQALRDVIRSQIVMLAEIMTRVVAIMFVVFFEMGTVELAITFAVSGTVSLIVTISISRDMLSKISLKSLDWNLLSEYATFAKPLAIATILTTVTLYFDKVIIQFAFSAAETGTYFAAQRYLRFYGFLSTAIISLLFPMFSSLNSKDAGKDTIAVMIRAILRYLLIIVIPLTIFLVVFAEPILTTLTSSAFAPGATAFAILSITYSISILTGPSSSQTLGMGFVTRFARYILLYCIIVIFLDLVLIPNEILSVQLLGWGINGAALAMFFGQVVMTVLFYLNTARVLKIQTPEHMFRIIASSVFAILVTYIISLTFNIARFYDLMALLLLFFGIYASLIVVTKVMSFSEILKLLKMLSLKNLLMKPE